MRTKGQIRIQFLTAGFFLLQGFFLSAQQMILSADKDTIGFNEAVIVRLSGEVKDAFGYAELPLPNGFYEVSHTNRYSMNGNNGKIKIDQTFILSPYSAGTFSIGPAWMQVGSNRVFSNKINIVVKAASKESASNEIMMRCEPDKKTAVVGEQVALTIRIYSRLGIELGTDRPMAGTFNGFWYYSGAYPADFKDSSLTYKGVTYKINTVYREFVFPNKSGKVKIPSYGYGCEMKQIPFPTGDPFTDNVMALPVPVVLVSEEVPFEIIPLPDENKPAGFAGDVGNFSLSAAIDKENIKANEAVKFTVVIGGKGNINFIQLPKLKFPDDIQSYPPVSTDSTTVGMEGMEGEKTFTITLIPKKEGSYTLPGVTFSYYDPKKKKYVTIQTPEFKLNVAPGDTLQNVSQNNLPETFLSDSSNAKMAGRILWIAIPALLLILLLYYRSQKKKNKNESIEPEKQTEEVADLPIAAVKKKPDILSMLQVAERFISNGNIQPGISQLYETLLSAVLFKTELGREEASIHQLRYRLGMKNLSPDLINETIQLLEELGAQRYANREADRSQLAENLQKTRKLSLSMLF